MYNCSIKYNFRGSGGATPRSCRIFENLRLLKLVLNMKNAKTNNANLCYNFSPRFLKTCFLTWAPCPHRVAYVFK